MKSSSEKLPIDQILLGDCIHILGELPEKSIDVIFADPPYNLQLKKELWRPNATRVNGVNDAWDHFSDFNAYDQFTHAWLSGCRRVLKDTGVIWVIGSYHNIFRVGKILQDLEYWILNDIVWIKNNPMPNFHGVRFTNAHETLIWAQKNRGNRYIFNYEAMKAINAGGNGNGGLQMRSDWKLPLCTGKERIKINGEKAHPTQKPEALLERVILSSSNPGDIVLDPFFGSGTTGAVAKKLGRHWLGIEFDQHYISIANQRIDNVTSFSGIHLAEIFRVPHRKKRIPFIKLLEDGYVSEGQVLYFGSQGKNQAFVLKDGNIRYGDLVGSIHKIGRNIRNAPCNGWLAWYYIEQETGERRPIDILRQKARLRTAQEVPGIASDCEDR